MIAIAPSGASEERRTAIERDGGHDLTPAGDASLNAAVAVAATVESDEARPGSLRPYARDVCREAAA